MPSSPVHRDNASILLSRPTPFQSGSATEWTTTSPNCSNSASRRFPIQRLRPANLPLLSTQFQFCLADTPHSDSRCRLLSRWYRQVSILRADGTSFRRERHYTPTLVILGFNSASQTTPFLTYAQYGVILPLSIFQFCKQTTLIQTTHYDSVYSLNPKSVSILRADGASFGPAPRHALRRSQ